MNSPNTNNHPTTNHTTPHIIITNHTTNSSISPMMTTANS
jgi:hypothetical protein